MANSKKPLEFRDRTTKELIPFYVKGDDVQLSDGKDLPTKLAEMDDAIEEAAEGGGYTPPEDGIPKNDLAQSVQDSLELADSSLQPSDKSQLQTAINTLQGALNTLIGSGNVEGAIDTFNEVVAFLSNINSSDTLVAKLAQIQQSIPSVDGFVTEGDVEGMIEDALEDLPTGDIPTKVSELVNDEGYITAETISDIVVGTGDIVIEDGPQYVEIFIYSPEMSVKLGGNEVSSLAFFSDPTQQESLSLAVSGSHLKANIVATLEGTDANKFSISGSPITQSGGAASGTLTVAYTGTTAAGQSASATLKLTCGDLVKTISLHYAYASGPFISVNPASLSFKAATGSTETKTLAISASQLTGDVVVSTPSGSAFQVCATENGTYGNSVTVAKADAEAGKTIYVKYTAGSSAASASVTVSSTDATSRTVELIGAVSTISVSKQSMTFSTDQGVAVTDTFTVEGANLNSNINIEANGTGFSVDKPTIVHNNGTVASTTVTVTYQPSAAGTHTGSISIQSSGVTKAISLSGTAAAATTSDENGRFTKDINGKTIYFGRISDGNGGFTDDVAVYAKGYGTSSAPTSANRYSGDIVIPATVACDGTTYDVTTIEGYAFGSASLTSISLPEGLTTIKANAFRKSTLPSVTIPSTVTAIGQYAFYDMASLVTANMLCAENQNFQTTWDGVFGKSSALVELVIPDKVTGFVQNSFNSMTGLRKITFGSNLAQFNAVFNGNGAPGVTTVICRGTTTKPQLASGETFYQDFIANATIYVPDGYKQEYIDNVYWVVQFNNAGRLKEMSELPTNE